MPTTVDQGLRFTSGVIRVASFHQVIDHPDVRVWEIDLSSKYPELWSTVAFEEEGDRHTVVLVPGEHTLRRDESVTNETTFEFTTPMNENWVVITDYGRYNVRIVTYRHPGFEDA